MTKTMPYWLYKTGYTMFPADNYNKAKKTIEVELPYYKKPRFPADWKRNGNTYQAPNGCQVIFWASGLAENFVVEHYEETASGWRMTSTTFPACLDVRDKVIAFVNSIKA